MTNDINNWIKAVELSHDYKGYTIWRFAVQAELDNGNKMLVAFLKESQEAVQGGLEATPDQIKKLKELNVLED